MATKRNRTANEAYESERDRIFALLKRIEEKMANHGRKQRETEGSKLNWGYVGDLRFVRERLQELAEDAMIGC